MSSIPTFHFPVENLLREDAVTIHASNWNIGKGPHQIGTARRRGQQARGDRAGAGAGAALRNDCVYLDNAGGSLVSRRG